MFSHLAALCFTTDISDSVNQCERTRNTLNWHGVLDWVNCTWKKDQLPVSKVAGSRPVILTLELNLFDMENLTRSFLLLLSLPFWLKVIFFRSMLFVEVFSKSQPRVSLDCRDTSIRVDFFLETISFQVWNAHYCFGVENAKKKLARNWKNWQICCFGSNKITFLDNPYLTIIRRSGIIRQYSLSLRRIIVLV